MQFEEHTQNTANCIPPAEVALNLAVRDFERDGEMGMGGGERGKRERVSEYHFPISRSITCVPSTSVYNHSIASFILFYFQSSMLFVVQNCRNVTFEWRAAVDVGPTGSVKDEIEGKNRKRPL